MLKALSIKNIAVIENVNIDFENGFNILTGETGAGKSIIIDSLNLLKGERAQKNIIRNGETKARVDGVFELGENEAAYIADLIGTDPEEEVIISREITVEGKGAIRINGVPVTQAMLKSAGERLITIHGQHDNQALLTPSKHIDFLDECAKTEECRASYRKIYSELKNLKDELESLSRDEKEKSERMDLLRYQVDEIDEAELEAGEEDELVSLRDEIANAEEISER